MEENLTTQIPQITSRVENKNNKTKKLLRVLIAFLTVGVISMLLVSGPADAYTLKLTSDKTTVNSGDDITFNVKVNINVDSGEYSKINTITLALNGPEEKLCVFSASGNMLSGCEGVKSITLTSSLDESSLNFSDPYYGYNHGGYNYGYSFYGYFYGYGYDRINMEYKVVLNTEGYAIGIYNTSVKIVAGSEIIEYAGGNIEIKESDSQNTTQTTRSRGGNSKSIKLEKGITQKIDISQGDVFSIVSDKYIHQLTIRNINNDSIRFLLQSDYQEFNLKVGETKELDLDEDGVMDASISIWYIGKNGEGSMFMIQSYNSVVTQKQTKNTIQPKIINGSVSNSYTSSSKNSDYTFDQFLSDYDLVIFFIIINLVVLMFVILVYFAKIKPKKKVKNSRSHLVRH